MNLIPAPGREWRKWSTLIGVALTTIGSIEIFLRAIQGQGVIPDAYLVPTLATLGALSLAAKFVQQSIPATPEQKEQLVEAAQALPVKPTKESA